jgi:hypothetical protein
MGELLVIVFFYSPVRNEWMTKITVAGIFNPAKKRQFHFHGIAETSDNELSIRTK